MYPSILANQINLFDISCRHIGYPLTMFDQNPCSNFGVKYRGGETEKIDKRHYFMHSVHIIQKL
jgi:hypothetical protein